MAKKIWLYVMGAGYIVAGLIHFLKPGGYVKMVEDYLPYPLAMIYISGIAEMAGGLGLMIPFTRRAAAIGIILLLLAIFPANIYMALYHAKWPDTPVWLLWARLPIQFVLLYLAYIYVRKDPKLGDKE
jgi:uncharacterized membrane protein